MKPSIFYSFLSSLHFWLSFSLVSHLKQVVCSASVDEWQPVDQLGKQDA